MYPHCPICYDELRRDLGITPISLLCGLLLIPATALQFNTEHASQVMHYAQIALRVSLTCQ